MGHTHWSLIYGQLALRPPFSIHVHRLCFTDWLIDVTLRLQHLTTQPLNRFHSCIQLHKHTQTDNNFCSIFAMIFDRQCFIMLTHNQYHRIVQCTVCTYTGYWHAYTDAHTQSPYRHAKWTQTFFFQRLTTHVFAMYIHLFPQLLFVNRCFVNTHSVIDAKQINIVRKNCDLKWSENSFDCTGKK